MPLGEVVNVTDKGDIKKLCAFSTLGRCRNEEGCSFKHAISDEEKAKHLKQIPGWIYRDVGKYRMAKKELTPEQLAEQLQEKGFYVSVEEIKKKNNESRESNISKCCFFYAVGEKCLNGDKCVFKHSDDPTSQVKAVTTASGNMLYKYGLYKHSNSTDKQKYYNSSNDSDSYKYQKKGQYQDATQNDNQNTQWVQHFSTYNQQYLHGMNEFELIPYYLRAFYRGIENEYLSSQQIYMQPAIIEIWPNIKNHQEQCYKSDMNEQGYYSKKSNKWFKRNNKDWYFYS